MSFVALTLQVRLKTCPDSRDAFFIGREALVTVWHTGKSQKRQWTLIQVLMAMYDSLLQFFFQLNIVINKDVLDLPLRNYQLLCCSYQFFFHFLQTSKQVIDYICLFTCFCVCVFFPCLYVSCIVVFYAEEEKKKQNNVLVP